MNAISTRLGRNVTRCRKHAGMSQEELSLLASLHRTEVSQLERGLRLCRIDTLVKVAGSLRVSPDDLLDGIVWSPGNYSSGKFIWGRGEEQ